jgi:hypothetical protein
MALLYLEIEVIPMDQQHIIKKLTLSCVAVASLFMAAPALALTVMTPVPVYSMPGSAAPVINTPPSPVYRTVTYGTQRDGTLGMVIHHPGYAVGSDGVVTPEIDHGYYRVTSQGQVEPTDNSGCHDGYCPMPGKTDQSQPATETDKTGFTITDDSAYGLSLQK